MTQEPFGRGDWQAVIDAHRLESHDATEWLRYGSALLHTMQPGPKAGKQQQAALAFVQAQREGASAGAMASAQRQVVMTNLRQALQLAGVPGSAEPARVTVLAMRICNPEGAPLWRWPEPEAAANEDQMLPVRGLNSGTMVLPGGVVLAATADPGVVLDVPDLVLQQLEADAQLELEALWQQLPADVAKLALEGKSAGHTTISALPDHPPELPTHIDDR